MCRPLLGSAWRRSCGVLSRCGSSNRGVFYNVTVDEVFSPSFGALSTTSSNHNRSFRNAADRRCSRSWGSECKIRVRATLPSCSLERKSPPIVVALPADCATSAAATTRDRRIDSCAGWVGPLPGAIERALSGSRRHTRRCRGRLDAPAATRVGNPPIRANARVGQGYTYASVGRVETDLGRPTGRVSASEFPCVRRGGIACRFVAPGIRAAFLCSDSAFPATAAPGCTQGDEHEQHGQLHENRTRRIRHGASAMRWIENMAVTVPREHAASAIPTGTGVVSVGSLASGATDVSRAVVSGAGTVLFELQPASVAEKGVGKRSNRSCLGAKES